MNLFTSSDCEIAPLLKCIKLLTLVRALINFQNKTSIYEAKHNKNLSLCSIYLSTHFSLWYVDSDHRLDELRTFTLHISM